MDTYSHNHKEFSNNRIVERAPENQLSTNNLMNSKNDLDENVKNINFLIYSKILRKWRINDTNYYSGIKSFEESVNSNQRDNCALWILNVCFDLGMTLESMSVAVYVFDYYIKLSSVSVNEYFTIASSSVLLASKIGDPTMRLVCPYLVETNPIISEQTIVQTELEIFQFLNYNISFITPLYFIGILLQFHNFKSPLQTLSNLISLCFMTNSRCRSFLSETIALSSILIASDILEIPDVQEKFTCSTETIHECKASIIESLKLIVYGIIPTFFTLYPECSEMIKNYVI